MKFTFIPKTDRIFLGSSEETNKQQNKLLFPGRTYLVLFFLNKLFIFKFLLKDKFSSILEPLKLLYALESHIAENIDF